MDVRTYRARNLREALRLIREELGPDAAVLHTREIFRPRLFGLLPGRREIEVTASVSVNVPSYLASAPRHDEAVETVPAIEQPVARTVSEVASTAADSDGIAAKLDTVHSMLQELCRKAHVTDLGALPDALFRVYTDLIEADISEELARQYVEKVRRVADGQQLSDPVLAKAHVTRLIEEELAVTGPIKVQRGQRRVVALVGPTGVGKTTTIAKLAANYRLRDKLRVGLITVDTYRIAAVEQLRTYAEIIDLPMEVVSTPREMRQAVQRLDHMDLVLIDTAGRSPRDEVKIQELRAFMQEAQADEIHLVLSTAASARSLEQTAERFASVGVTAVLLTKLDETAALGNVLPLVRNSGLPVSYLTNGQNVPDDIEVASPSRLARLILGTEPVHPGRLGLGA